MKGYAKTFVGILAVALVVGLLAWAFIKGRKEIQRDREGVRPTETQAHLSRTASAENVVALDAETQKRARLVIAPASAATLRPEVKAYGRVLDPTSLVTLHGDLLTAEAALTNSAAQLQRTRTLFLEDRNASRRALDAAEAEFRANEVRAQVARSRLNLEWGEGIAGLDAAARATLIEQLLNRRTALLRVDLPMGEASLPELPASAHTRVGRRFTVSDHRDSWLWSRHRTWIGVRCCSLRQCANSRIERAGDSAGCGWKMV